jgi:hypothetical protein
MALVDSLQCFAKLTPSAPNDVDLRFADFLLWAKWRRYTSKYLNFPPYDVIHLGIKLKSMISATNTAVRWSNLVLKEENLGYLFIAWSSHLHCNREIYGMPPEKIGLGCQICPLWEPFMLWLHTIVFIRIILQWLQEDLMNKYWKFQGKIITLSSFLWAPQKGYNLRTLGPQRTFAKKWWALKVLKRF